MARLFGIAGVQMSVVPWDADANLERMERAVTRIAASFPWVRMVLFHELAAPGVVQLDARPDPDQLRRVQQPIPGPISDRLCALARRSGVWLVPGTLYERDGDAVYNTALAISPEGEIVARYRKMFPWYPLEAGTTPGRDFCVFDVPDAGRFGLSICYDMWFPETVRSLVWMGAEVILHPTLTTTSDRELEVVLSQASAIANQCYFVDVNGVGPWGGGHSMVVDPDGRVVQKRGETPTIFTEVLDLDRVARAREYGNLALAQTLKQLRDARLSFPPYVKEFGDGEGIAKLGPLELPTRLE